jgi:PPK2 family polyphosphate:nucleotide phosphotransferase
LAKARRAALDDYRYAGAAVGAGARASKDRRFELARIDPAARPCSSGDKARDKARVEDTARELDRLQELLYADRRYKLLIILQGIDTSGKDGTIRGVFGQMSALGVRTVGWKAPTEQERAHDFLWRIHQAVPGAGEVVLFNRSQYEDVLVPVVDGTIDRDETARRYHAINDFERMLVESGTVVVKFMLHISRGEQRERLQARIDDPTKRWKLERGDIEVRKHWDAYQRAYSDAIDATGTAWAPWHIVPAESKTHRNLMVAEITRRSLAELPLRYPPGDPTLRGLHIE